MEGRPAAKGRNAKPLPPYTSPPSVQIEMKVVKEAVKEIMKETPREEVKSDNIDLNSFSAKKTASAGILNISKKFVIF